MFPKLGRWRAAYETQTRSGGGATRRLTRRLESTPMPGDEAGWLITLSDLTLLLLCFLVLWYVAKVKKPTPEPTPIAMAQPSRAPEESLSIPPQTLQWEELRNEMLTYIGDLGLRGKVSVESNSRELLVSLNDTVTFASGRADLRPQALPLLEKVVSMVLNRPNIFIAASGHTDDVPISTLEFPSNWELSTARASRVARYLIEKGIASSRIAVQGYASQRPVAANTSAANRRANRRVEIRLYRPNEQLATG